MKTDEGRRNTAVVLSLVFILFSIYGFTTPKTVTLEDDGLFIMASLDGGVARGGGGEERYQLMSHHDVFNL